MNHRQKHLLVYLLALVALLCTGPIQGAWAVDAPSLGAASDFAALGGAGVTCTTGGVVGDVGSASSTVTTITGFPPTSSSCTLVGDVLYSPDTDVAYANFGTAYTLLAPDDGAYPCPSADDAYNLPLSLDGLPGLPPGVYCIGGAFPGVGTLSGVLTLDGGKDAVWIFKTNSLTTTDGGSVVMAGGGKACNVYWQTDTAATFADTDFLGTILAGSSISFTNSTLVGRALANTESVTMATSTITLSGASSESLKQDKKAFEADQKAVKTAFEAQQKLDKEDFRANNPQSAWKANEDLQKLAKKDFEDGQKLAKKAFDAGQKLAKC